MLYMKKDYKIKHLKITANKIIFRSKHLEPFNEIYQKLKWNRKKWLSKYLVLEFISKSFGK